MDPVAAAGRAIGLVCVTRGLPDSPVVVDRDYVVVELDWVADLVSTALVLLRAIVVAHGGSRVAQPATGVGQAEYPDR